jgi:hypothetical protein
MSAHTTHHMDGNSLLAYATLPLTKREQDVLSALERLGGVASDRQIAREMGSADPNISRPRCTALIERGVLRVVGHQAENGRRCRLVERAP